MRKRIGDTLVEVTLAIGIFSMVAIAVVAVVSGSSSGAQSSLETTVTREQIDTQAEALRFIHNSYIADIKSDKDEEGIRKYTKLWRAMTTNTNEERDFGEEKLRMHLNPTSCAEVYNGALQDHHAFIINTRALGINNMDNIDASQLGEIIVKPQADKNNKFQPPATYPRLVYGTNSNDMASSLSDNDLSSSKLSAVEGLYIIPVKDTDSTVVVTSEAIQRGSAYYDFYVVSCWYAGNSDRPSTISTVVRLYDPDAITESAQDRNIKLIFNSNGGTGRVDSITVPLGGSVSLPTSGFARTGYNFLGWNTDRNSSTAISNSYTAPSTFNSGQRYVDFYAIWKPIPYNLRIIYKDGGNIIGEETKSNVQVGQKITVNGLSNAGDEIFTGWSIVEAPINSSLSELDGGKQTLTTGDNPKDETSTINITLAANWSKRSRYRINYNTNTNQQISSHDCDNSQGACRATTTAPTRSDYNFGGWCITSVSVGLDCSINAFNSGDIISYDLLDQYSDGNNNVTLYAIWLGSTSDTPGSDTPGSNDPNSNNPNNPDNIVTITAKASWDYGRLTDFDSYVSSKKSDGTTLSVNRSNLVGKDTDGSIIAQLDHDCSSKCGDETITIYAREDRNYYYYIKRSSLASFSSGDLKVQISSPEFGTQIVDPSKAFIPNVVYTYWNVFAYINGELVIKNTITRSPDTSYTK